MKNCSSGQYFCHDRGKCMPIPKGHKVRKDGELVKEVAPPGWGHTKAEKEKTKPDKPKSKIGGTAAAFKRALDRGDFKGLPGSKTKKEKTSDMFKLMWAMKNKGDKPHYKPGSDKKYKKYQEEETSMPFVSDKDKGAIKKRAKNLFKKDLKGTHVGVNEEEVKEGTSIIQGRTSKKKVSYRGATADHKRDKDGNIEAAYYGKKEDKRTDAKKKKHTDAVRKFDNYKKLQAEISAREDARKKHNQEYAASKRANEEVIYEKLSAKDAKKLDKASALSQSDNPKDQDRARARQTEVDYKDLMRQIHSKKKKVGKSQMTEKYGDTFDTPKYKKKSADSEKENTNRDLRMKHGKKWRDFTKDALAAKQKDKGLKRGEVKKLVDGKWVSNKD